MYPVETGAAARYHGGEHDPVTTPDPRTAAPRPIGSVTMKADGTLILDLRAEGPGGMIGDARFVYAPDHPNYAAVLAHVGPLSPGQSAPVRPWENG